MPMQTETLTPATDASEIPKLVAKLREAFESGRTRPIEWRRRQLQRMKAMLEEREADFLDALAADLGKPRLEGWATDVAIVINEIEHALRHLASWMKPERVWTPLAQRPGRATVRPEPFGVALVIAPWNYPVHLLLLPMVGALAAGNAVVGKPSEVSAHTLGGAGAPRARVPRPRRCRDRRGWRHRDAGASRGTVRLRLLHRQRSRRPGRHGGGRQASDPGDTRARRQVPRDRRRRRQHRGCGAPHRLRQVPERGSDVHRARLRARRTRPTRGARGADRPRDP